MYTECELKEEILGFWNKYGETSMKVYEENWDGPAVNTFRDNFGSWLGSFFGVWDRY